nr:hypothetical protein [Lonsdalea britannica]
MDFDTHYFFELFSYSDFWQATLVVIALSVAPGSAVIFLASFWRWRNNPISCHCGRSPKSISGFSEACRCWC